MHTVPNQKSESQCCNLMCRNLFKLLHRIDNLQKLSPTDIIFAFLFSFLATDDSYTGLCACFRMGRSTVHEIINETCEAIWQALQPDFMKPPTRQDWEQIEKGFRLKWHFPNCVGDTGW